MKHNLIYSLIVIAVLASCQSEKKNTSEKSDSNQTLKKDKIMQDQDFKTTLVVNQTPEQVFNAINNVRGWWSEEIEGNTTKLNDEFRYHFQDVHHCKMRLIEIVPNQKAVWLVLENQFKFTKDQTEWVGTKIIFDISKKGDKTQLAFTHQGLIPKYECYAICRDAWTNYIQNSLADLIRTGKGKPNGKEKPQTAAEKKLAKG